MDYKELYKQAKAKATEAKALLTAETSDVGKANELLAEAEKLRQQAEALKSAQGILDAAGAVTLPVDLPTEGEPKPAQNQAAAIKTIYQMQFGDEGAAVKAILTDLHGVDYEQKRWQQWQGFAKYLRTGKGESREFLWTPSTIKQALMEGMDVYAMKTVMVESADTLGGYVVPEDWRAEVISRMAALTVIRPKARVIQTTRDAVELPKITGGTSQYRDAVRVTWVDETPTAGTAATNLTFGLERIPVHTVMAETFLSRNLVEDAAFNIVAWLADSFASAQAIDEDNQFLTGDGHGKPEGILKDSGIGVLGTGQQVVSGDADELTADGIINLVYAIDAQYRQNAAFVAEKATYRDIRKLKTGDGEYIWERNYQSGQPDRLLGYPVLEQEGMPTIAANAFPLLFGDLRGYVIVDRVGMSVERYIDSATARINQVCYVARRRLGGECVETWRFVAQKCST